MQLKDLAQVCQRLNQEKVEYLLVGGFAMILHGYERATRDIDFLVDPSVENIERIKTALIDLLPEACTEIRPQDVMENTVVRMVGENIIVDLIKEVGPHNYQSVLKDCFFEEIEGIRIPVGGLDSMIELKKGVRERDQRDYLFLIGKKEYLERQTKKKP